MSESKNKQFNPIGLDGIEFIEYTSSNPEALEKTFQLVGFVKVADHKTKNASLYRQRGINFILNKEKESFAEKFNKDHGPSVCATGFRVASAEQALKNAVERGAKEFTGEGHAFPCIYGIGDSLIYFVDSSQDEKNYEEDFNFVADKNQKGVGLLTIDHLTNNVQKNKMEEWCNFYKDIFNFREVRFFDIQGKETGLVSKVMRSPCDRITIPINEPRGEKSQIQEYIEEYKGAGIQHIALSTANIYKSVNELKNNGVRFLETPDTYYEFLPKRLPHINENIEALQDLRILVDGDEDGYLLQIFTQNLVGPIFFEIIQRKNHEGFGEGNFQALFESIEEDQRRRGYL